MKTSKLIARFVFAPSLLAIAAGGGAACSSSDSTTGKTTPTGETPVIIAQGVTILEGALVEDIAVFADKLVMPLATHTDLLTKKPGEFLVGDSGSKSSANRDGFLRKIVSIKKDASTLTFITVYATLPEVVQSGEIKGTLETPQLGIDGPIGTGTSLAKGGGDPIKLLDFSGKSLLDYKGSVTIGTKTVGVNAYAKVKVGTLNFTPTWDYGAKFKPKFPDILGSLEEAHLWASGKVDAEAQFDVGLKLDSTLTGEDIAKLVVEKITKKTSTTLAEYEVKLGKLKIGPIPITVKAKFKTTMECDFRWGGEVSVVVGAKASATIKAGFTYSAGAITPVWEKGASFEQIGPVWTNNADVFLKCSLKPSFEVNLFDMATGEIWAEPYFALGAQASCDAGKLLGEVEGFAYAGVSATAHAKIDALGLYEWEKTCTLFDLESPRKSVKASWPLGKGGTCSEASKVPLTTTAKDSPTDSCFGKKTETPPEPTGERKAGACLPSGSTPDAKWTCDASKYGDCVCDCSCGAPDVDCKAGACATCEHDVCTNGSPLGLKCDKDGQGGACIKAICEKDPYCCTEAWSESCIDRVKRGDFGCTPRSCGAGG